MRNATILVVNLRGVATETIKNIVLAGIGKLIMWDCEDVAAEDLGVGFFFRDEDVGKKVRIFALFLIVVKLLLRRAGSSLNRPPRLLGLFFVLFSSPTPAYLHGYNFPFFFLALSLGLTARGCGKVSYRKSQSARCGRDYDVSVRARTGRVRRVGAGRGPGVYNGR